MTKIRDAPGKQPSLVNVFVFKDKLYVFNDLDDALVARDNLINLDVGLPEPIITPHFGNQVDD